MIEPSRYVKHYASAKHRFLQASIVKFFQREFPLLLGPAMYQRIAQELVALVDKQLPEKATCGRGNASGTLCPETVGPTARTSVSCP